MSIETRQIDWKKQLDPERAAELHTERLRREEDEAARLKDDLESSMRAAASRGLIDVRVRRGK